MVIKSSVGAVVRWVYNSIRFCIDTLVYIAVVVTTFCNMVLNTILSFVILLEEMIVFCLVIPWIPVNKVGDIVCYLRKWGFPVKLPLSLYIFFVVLFLTLSFLSLELHYLQANEGLTSSFDEFKSSTFTAIKIFVIIHRFLYLLSNESSLRKTCKILKKRLKFEQNEELDDAELAEGLEDDLQVEKLRFELDETREQLESLRRSYSELQQELKRKTL
ncbi:uncharacterized protein CDAR_524041 [Caerostris darwini]|uniref:Endoplasmic reticulum transmembrane protein n=1 Tax=Caerostris darwini TaxID=1538125 RepID=A0AAV4TT39_9ARAC|nr:uncharacterized protein CDAR_524041 [Caerostris darwini]